MNEPARKFHPASAAPVLRAVDRYAQGPGEIICWCGYRFDPLQAPRWRCGHCGERWPWAELTVDELVGEQVIGWRRSRT